MTRLSTHSLSRPRRVAVLGVGAMGRRHVRVLSEMSDLYELTGVFDADRGVAEEVARVWKVPVFCDATACVDAAEIVVIASPIGAHAAGARFALERGCHVLVEKPLCASLSDASALVRTAARHSALLFVGHSERFNPVILALRELVRPQDVRAISIRRATSAPILPEGRVREEGVLLSLGVHDVDLVSYLTGAPVELRKVSGMPSGNDDDRAELTLIAATGAVAQVIADRIAPRRERTIELATRNEVFEGDLLVPRLVRRPRGVGGPRTPVELVSIEPLAEQARAVALALDGGGSRWAATGVDGARALAVALEARQRLRAEWAERRVSEAS
jgi:UDP-N-acetylglucosamine 3-dehydrogenase